MAQKIEDYALIGNGATAALVGKNGSIDWLCFPRFDSAACFAALLGDEGNGFWRIAPASPKAKVHRRYRQGTLVLETEFTTPEGSVVVVDCMDRRGDDQDVLRLVRGVRGSVPMSMELCLRFEYGSVVPWVTRQHDNGLRAIAGPDMMILRSEVPLRNENFRTYAEFTVEAGQEVPFAFTWAFSYVKKVTSPDVRMAVKNQTEAWEKWSSSFHGTGPYKEAVLRSLITLKALTHHQTGGIVAAPTTSLPEQAGGERNWDYRYCWLRDSTFTLYALLESGFQDEAKAWREWLLRAIAGSPNQMQIMYGLAGERRLTEFELPWLTGYENSRPVRIGNAASEQLQLDVFGEVMDSLYQARKVGLAQLEAAWELECALVTELEEIWNQPDEGIWEVRGGPRQFTYSKVMTWVAFDRAVRTIEELGAEGPLDRWKKVRSQIHEEVCRSGFNKEKNCFVQYFGSDALDASLLMLPLVGFLPPDDPRVRSTIAAIEKELMEDGFVLRYRTDETKDGLKGREGVFLACSFWLVDNYILQNRNEEARELFDRLMALRNDVGLLSEEYDPQGRRQLGNFPQAFSHLALVNSAHNFGEGRKPARHRSIHA
jgi:GH15 family glucan-1,4-alpha-glucosidase